MTKGSRARDRQRHRERAQRELAGISTRGLVDELIRRSEIGTGEIKIAIRDRRFLQYEYSRELSRDELLEYEAKGAAMPKAAPIAAGDPLGLGGG